MDPKVRSERFERWHTCSLCEQQYHGVVYCALGWACWKTYVGRPEADQFRGMAMNQLGNGLHEAERHADALTVREAELSMRLRLGDSAINILSVQTNLASTYSALGRQENAVRMSQNVYSGRFKLLGEEHPQTLLAANNYADSLNCQLCFEEAKTLLRKTMPVARRVLGENDVLTLSIRANYARALYKADGATLGDLREAVSTLEDTGRIAQRVFGGAHPLTLRAESNLRNARAVLAARDGDDASSVCEALRKAKV